MELLSPLISKEMKSKKMEMKGMLLEVENHKKPQKNEK